MQRVFTTPYIGLARLVRRTLQEHGIVCAVREAARPRPPGSSLIVNRWPEVWVRDDERAPDAERIAHACAADHLTALASAPHTITPSPIAPARVPPPAAPVPA